MSQPVRMVQIGVGGFGARWVDAQGSSSRLKTVALVDIDRSALASAGKQLGVPGNRQFSTVDDLAEIEFDAAIICTPPATRPGIYEALARDGKGILTEKPLARSMDEARAALALKRETGVSFVVAQNYRYRPEVQAAKRLISSGTYGRPCICQVDFFKHPRFGGFRRQMAHPLIIDMSIHHFDLSRFLLAAEPIAVTGRSWSAPWSMMAGDAAATVLFEMSDRIRFVYNGSWITLRPEEHQTTWTGNWTVECEAGCVTIRNDRICAWPGRASEDGLPSRGDPQIVEVEQSAGEQSLILDQFIDELCGGPAAPTSIEDNIRSLAMVHAAVEACDQGTTLDVPTYMASP